MSALAYLAAIVLHTVLIGATAIVGRSGTLTALSPAQIAAYRPYAFYASTAYCQPSQTLTWSCGSNCNANPSFKPVASGGDGDDVQFWYVGYDPTLQTVIVAHQGTDTSDILPLITDIDIFKSSLDQSLFPGISSSVEVHDGFKGAQSAAALDVLAAVQSAVSTYAATKVTIVGHSLGAAIALLDSVFLPLHVPGISWQTVTFGLPRVGNQDFANYVDGHISSLTHITHQKDPVPILPGMFLGFHHPSGEVHIDESDAWIACPGQDNSSKECSTGDVPEIWDGDESDHDGPYGDVTMGC